jgi:hypothetical protein
MRPFPPPLPSYSPGNLEMSAWPSLWLHASCTERLYRRSSRGRATTVLGVVCGLAPVGAEYPSTAGLSLAEFCGAFATRMADRRSHRSTNCSRKSASVGRPDGSRACLQGAQTGRRKCAYSFLKAVTGFDDVRPSEWCQLGSHQYFLMQPRRISHTLSSKLTNDLISARQLCAGFGRSSTRDPYTAQTQLPAS